MKKKIKVILPYVKDTGEDAEYTFDIGFISNRIVRDFTEINKSIKAVQEAGIKVIKAQGKLTDPKVKAADIQKAQEIIEKEGNAVQDLATEDFFKLRFDIIKRILNMNGYNDEVEYLTFKFWDENVEPAEINTFLSTCVFKDVDLTKK